jgi:hypothetical protein
LALVEVVIQLFQHATTQVVLILCFLQLLPQAAVALVTAVTMVIQAAQAVALAPRQLVVLEQPIKVLQAVTVQVATAVAAVAAVLVQLEQTILVQQQVQVELEEQLQLLVHLFLMQVAAVLVHFLATRLEAVHSVAVMAEHQTQLEAMQPQILVVAAVALAPRLQTLEQVETVVQVSLY